MSVTNLSAPCGITTRYFGFTPKKSRVVFSKRDMNIFYLDHNPEIVAKWHVDKHVVKMPLEAAQMLSTAHHVLASPNADKVYKVTHVNHPCSVWTRHNAGNYLWVVSYFDALAREYTERYGKTHKSHERLYAVLKEPPSRIDPSMTMTPPAICMPKEFITSGNPIASYQRYYRDGKRAFHAWKNRPVPPFIELFS